MQIARVLGTIVSTQKEPSLTGVKFLLLQILDQEGQPLPEYEVAADSIGAGIDEWVLVSRGSAARQIPRGEQRPVDAAVIAIIDSINARDRLIYSKREQYR
jgi:carbon dioxide concentrating mechanism protein CcmL